MAVVSCGGSDDPEAKLDRFESARSFHVITPVGGSHGVYSVSDDVRYSFAFNDDERLVSFTIHNFCLSEDDVPCDYTFNNVPWVYSIGTPSVQRVINLDGLYPSLPENAPHSLTDVKIIYYEAKESSPNSVQGIAASFVVDGAYRFIAYPYSVVGEGTTVSTNKVNGESRMCYTTVAEVEFSPESGSAVVEMRGIHPDESDNVISFTLPGVSVRFTESGYVLGYTGAVVPENGVTISEFHGEATMTDELYIRFMMTLDSGGEYEVQCRLTPNLTPQLWI